MINALLSVFCILGFHGPSWDELEISREQSLKIGERIWHNECKCSFEGLTHWNQGENFPSLGIAHFIWYPDGVVERFEETFPLLLAFLEQEGVTLPEFLKHNCGSLWSTREEFLKQFHSPLMKQLRDFLYQTRDLQIKFIITRLHDTFLISLKSLDDVNECIEQNFSKLLKDPRGVYALIDYYNFKGSGLNKAERYDGMGWGLMQVLSNMSLEHPDPVVAFVFSARSVLKQRVINSPKERNEKIWLKGWLNRVETYLDECF